jgi:hypothetical protein
MALYGDLSSMQLPDLLQWAGQAGKTGTLELERHNHVKRIHFRKGRLIGCSSEDPPSRLGQFLLSRGKISESQLGDGLARQQVTGDNLGNILVAMGAISREELVRHVGEKAEETIYGLFDWPDAAFRFIEDAPPDPWLIEVDIRVEDVLLHGMRRFDEMNRMRAVFDNPAIVLRRTQRPAPAEITGHRAANAIYSSVDGRRTLEELLLHTHASEFFAMKFLFQLLRSGLIEIAGVAAKRELEDLVSSAATRAQAAAGEAQASAAVAVAPPPAQVPSPAVRPESAMDAGHEASVSGEIEMALSLMSRNEPEAALAILGATYRSHPGDPTLRELLGKAEAASRDNAVRILDPRAVPILTRPAEEIAKEPLSPTESYLTSLLDGKSDVRTVLWLAPMREIDVLHALKSMLERNLIELRQPSGPGPL